jgi:2-hydroxycyclohexanecarboxyl-CoA dehydrogenase
MKQDMVGTSAVVLGGTKGIGRASVRKLAERGANVVIQGRDEDAAASIVAECASWPGERLFVKSDLSTYEGIEQAVAAAHERFGKVDVVVASGGPIEPRPKLFVDMGPEEGMACLQSRLMPRLHALHAAVKYMRGQKYGKIILIGTDAARIPTPSESMIGAAGAVVMFLTRALATELAGLGIRINTVSTTLTTDTPRHDSFLRAKEAGSQEIIVKAFTKAEQRVAFRLNTARDIAEYVSYLAGPESDQVSGSTLSINGGLSFHSY